jgi:hypothetical protein
MPRYTFRVPIGPDSDPIQLADDREAWGELVLLCAHTLQDVDGSLLPSAQWRFMAIDDQGAVVHEIAISAHSRGYR